MIGISIGRALFLDKYKIIIFSKIEPLYSHYYTKRSAKFDLTIYCEVLYNMMKYARDFKNFDSNQVKHLDSLKIWNLD